MESYYLQHSVLRDRDPDELGGRINSDSEASDDDDEITDRIHSVADPAGPWTQKPVDGETWGKSTRGVRGGKRRDFASANTGPKGVIKDYKDHKRYQKQERLREKAGRQTVLTRLTKGATVPVTPSALVLSNHLKCECDGNVDCECDDNNLVDDAVLAQYAKMRMNQMQKAACNRTVYGELEYITPERFVKLTSRADNDNIKSSMLVHLYHPDDYVCGLFNTCLEVLARKLVHIKFSALVAKEADASIKTADLPVVVIFRGPQQEVILDVVRLLDGGVNTKSVEAFVIERLK